MSPVYNKTARSCLRFHYHLRGQEAGSLKVFTRDVNETTKHPHEVQDISVRNIMYEASGHMGDRWHYGMIDLPAGLFVIGFEGSARSSNLHPHVGIDDVQLIDGTCNTYSEFFNFF